MTTIDLGPQPAIQPAEVEAWTRGHLVFLRVMTVIGAASLAGMVGDLHWLFGIEVWRWALPLLLVATSAALSWRPDDAASSKGAHQ